jgi:hypothetical protein
MFPKRPTRPSATQGHAQKTQKVSALQPTIPLLDQVRNWAKTATESRMFETAIWWTDKALSMSRTSNVLN